MLEHTIDHIENVEAELAGLRDKLHESFSHFDELKRIIASSEALGRANEEYIEALNTLREEHARIVDDTEKLLKMVENSLLEISGRIDEQLETGLNNVASAIEDMAERFAALQKEIQAHWDELNAKFDSLTEDLYTSQRNLRTEFAGKITDFQRDYERRMASFIEDWNTYKTTIQQQVDENTKKQSDLKKWSTDRVSEISDDIVKVRTELASSIENIKNLIQQQHAQLNDLISRLQKALEAQKADTASQIARIDQEIQTLNTTWQERFTLLDSRLSILTSDLNLTQEYGRKTRKLFIAIFLPSLVLIAIAVIVLFIIK